MTAGARVFVSEEAALALVREAAERGVRAGHEAGWRAGWDARGREDEHAFARLSAERNKLARLLADRVPRRLYEAARAESDACDRAHDRACVLGARLRGRLFASRDTVKGLDRAVIALGKALADANRDRDAWREAGAALAEEAAAWRVAATRLVVLLDGPLNPATARAMLDARADLVRLGAGA